MKTKDMPRECFLMLAVVGWADGRLDINEGEAIVAAAQHAGLSGEDLDAVRKATRERVDARDVDVAAMSEEDKLYLYAAAVWVAAMDEEVTEAERAALGVIALLLGLTRNGRSLVDGLVDREKAKPAGDRLARFDLAGLRAHVSAEIDAYLAAG